MKITDIEAVPFSIPLRHPLLTSVGAIADAEHVLIRVHSDEGVTGIAEAEARPMTYGESQESIVAAVKRYLRPMLVGSDAFASQWAWEKSLWLIANNTLRGALDIALHDLRARAVGLPVWQLLGGCRQPMRVTRQLSMGPDGEVAAEAREAVSEYGITSFKIKIGTDPRADVSRVAAVRDAVGPDAQIYVDANHGYSTHVAFRVLGELEELGVDLVEEPTPASDLDGRRMLAARFRCPIMADESAPTFDAAVRELRAGAARAVSIKTTRTGFTESARIADFARGMGARALLGTQGDSMIGAAASLAFGATDPWVARESGELDHFLLFTENIVAEPLTVSEGLLWPAAGPGLGIEIDEDRLGKYRVDL